MFEKYLHSIGLRKKIIKKNTQKCKYHRTKNAISGDQSVK